MTGPLDSWLRDKARVRADSGLRRRTVAIRENSVDLASNDYLGLSRDPRVVRAASLALHRYGAGSRASRLVTGTLDVHTELEDALCDLTGQCAALVFSSGYAANTGLLTAVGDADTLIVSDRHAHASLVDGARLSRSPVVIAEHNNVEHVARLLGERAQKRAVVVVESIYSVLGDYAPLKELAAVCELHGALLVVDEAHGIGVAGQGRGLSHQQGLAGHPNVVLTVTLSKSLGAQGGAVLGSEVLREHLVNVARPFIFDTALAPASAAAAAEACRIVRRAPELTDRLHANGRVIAQALGIEHAPAAVQSVPIDSPELALRAAEALRHRGILVGCFRPPSVPGGISRLRLTARADVEFHDLTVALSAVRGVMAELGARPVEVVA